jgi:hypothetical protein
LAHPYAEGRDILFVRPDAVFNKSKPISGRRQLYKPRMQL